MGLGSPGFVYYLPGLAEMTWMFGSTFARFKQLGVSFDRLRKVMRGAPDEDLVAHGLIYLNDDMPPVPALERKDEDRLERLEVTDLTFGHSDTGRGIEDISLSLTRGSFTVVTGRIGSGKTTLLRVMLGLLPKERGEILWNGESVEDPASFFVPPRSAYTPQVPWLYICWGYYPKSVVRFCGMASRSRTRRLSSCRPGLRIHHRCRGSI